MSTITDRYAASQRAAITAAAEATILDGTSTAAEAAGPTLADIAAAHARSERAHRYLDAVEAHAPAEMARLNTILDAVADREVLRRLIVLQGVVEHLDAARLLLADDHLLADVIAARRGGPITPALHAHGLAAYDGYHHAGLTDRAVSALRVLTAALTSAPPVKP